MKLKINLLFVVDPRRREEISAECTVDGLCLRTAKVGVPIPASGGLFEWPDLTGMLEYQVTQDVKQNFRVGFYDKVRGDEEVPFGFCELSGNQGVETVPIQGSDGGESAAFACFEVRWVPTEDPMTGYHARVDEAPREFSILAKISPPPSALVEAPGSVAENESAGIEKFWFAYRYLRCDIKTDQFADAAHPRFRAITDTFRIRANSKDVNELLFNTPLVIRLFSSLRGVIALAVLTYRNQSARTVSFAWKRSPQDDLAEVSANLELVPFGGTVSQPLPQMITQATLPEELLPPPPPPPPPPPFNPSSESLLLIEKEMKHREKDLLERERECERRTKLLQDQQKQLAKLEEELNKAMAAVEKDRRALDRKEEDLLRKYSLKDQELKAQEKRMKEELDHRVKQDQLTARLKQVIEVSTKHQAREKRLETELIALKDQMATSNFGRQEKEISRLRGQLEDFQARLDRERQEKEELKRAKDEEIAVLALELQTMRLHGERLKTRPKRIAEAESALRTELRGVKEDEEAIKALKKSLPSSSATATTSALKKKSALAAVNSKLHGRRSANIPSSAEETAKATKSSSFFSTAGESKQQLPNELEELESLRKAREDLLKKYPEGYYLVRMMDESIAHAMNNAVKKGLM